MRVLISAEEIQRRLGELAQEIRRDYESDPCYSSGQPVTLVGVLNGSLMFLADLVRTLPLPTRLGFLRASSYRGETTTPGRLDILPGLSPDVRGRHVLLLDDILDSGKTLDAVTRHLRTQEPLSLRVAVLLRKIGRQEVPFEPDYVAFQIPDLFVVGYGLDYNDDYRQLPYIGELTAEVTAASSAPHASSAAHA